MHLLFLKGECLESQICLGFFFSWLIERTDVNREVEGVKEREMTVFPIRSALMRKEMSTF